MAASPNALPGWLEKLLSALLSLAVAWGAFQYQKGRMEADYEAQFRELKKEIKDLREGPIAEYQQDKRTRAAQDAQRLAAFEEAQARQYGQVAELAEKLKTAKR